MRATLYAFLNYSRIRSLLFLDWPQRLRVFHGARSLEQVDPAWLQHLDESAAPALPGFCNVLPDHALGRRHPKETG